MSGTLAWFLAAAGGSRLAQAAAIVLGTFILEDAATVLAAMRADEGGIPAALALVALYVGVAAGDIGLYGLGRLSARNRWIARMVPPQRSRALAGWLRGREFQVVLTSRFLPGMRLPAYTACGFLRADFRRFATAAVLGTLVWTTLLFGVSLRVGAVLIAHFGAWRWAGAAGFAIALLLIGRVAARFQPAVR